MVILEWFDSLLVFVSDISLAKKFVDLSIFKGPKIVAI